MSYTKENKREINNQISRKLQISPNKIGNKSRDDPNGLRHMYSEEIPDSPLPEDDFIVRAQTLNRPKETNASISSFNSILPDSPSNVDESWKQFFERTYTINNTPWRDMTNSNWKSEINNVKSTKQSKASTKVNTSKLNLWCEVNSKNTDFLITIYSQQDQFEHLVSHRALFSHISQLLY